jgi:hypothetical protein
MRALRYVALILLPMLVPSAKAAGRSRIQSQLGVRAPEGSAPYLLAIGPPPLRFQAYEPPPDLSTRLPAGAPPVPHADSSSNSSAPDVIPFEPEATSLPNTVSTTKTPTKENPVNPHKRSAPAPIIPDDTRPHVRPEDFLPYFQIPGSAQGPAEVSVVMPVPRTAPAPAPLPASSATYTTTPR